MSERDGGPAFPVDDGSATRNFHNHPGMSLRDWFAGLALSGLLAANATYGGRTDDRGGIARDAYAHADAMLAERKK